VSFTDAAATLTVRNTEKPEECIFFTSPMSTADLKGCHAVQNLGAVQTYIKRYLYQNAFEIVEADALDATMKPVQEVEKQEQKKEQKIEKKYMRIEYAIEKINSCKNITELKNTFLALKDKIAKDDVEKFIEAKDLAKASFAFDDAANEVVKIGRLSDANNK